MQLQVDDVDAGSAGTHYSNVNDGVTVNIRSDKGDLTGSLRIPDYATCAALKDCLNDMLDYWGG